jgi:hypothetical protein
MPYLEKGNRGGQVLIHDGYRYQKNKTTDNTIYWRCWRQECRVPLKTDLFDQGEDINVIESRDHDHPEDHEIIQENNIKNRMFEKVIDDPSKPIKRVFDEVVNDLNVPVEDIPEFYHVRSRMSRARTSLMPQIPHNVDDVVIEGDWRRS